MAIVQNFWLKKSKKRLAGAVLYQAMGQTRARELASSVANPRTTSQMSQRVKWSNLVNLYRANQGWMKYAFETKKSNQSDYNKFMSVNVAASQIYLPKSIANAGGCIVAPFVMTQGSLPSIEVTEGNDGWNTNIYLADASTLNSNSTVGEVSQQILAANPGIQAGDQLSFIRLTQMTNASTGVPYVVVRRYEVIIDATDTRPFYNFMSGDYISWDGGAATPYLTIMDSGNAGGFLMILSRTSGGKTYVSTQQIVVANNAALINAYSSESAKAAAIASYGEEADAFLSTTSANEDSQAATALAVISALINDTSYVAGDTLYPIGNLTGVGVRLYFNGAIDATSATATMRTRKNYALHSIELEVDDIEDNWVAMTAGTVPTTRQEDALYDITITLNGVEYRIVFDVPAAADGGLE